MSCAARTTTFPIKSVHCLSHEEVKERICENVASFVNSHKISYSTVCKNFGKDLIVALSGGRSPTPLTYRQISSELCDFFQKHAKEKINTSFVSFEHSLYIEVSGGQSILTKSAPVVTSTQENPSSRYYLRKHEVYNAHAELKLIKEALLNNGDLSRLALNGEIHITKLGLEKRINVLGLIKSGKIDAMALALKKKIDLEVLAQKGMLNLERLHSMNLIDLKKLHDEKILNLYSLNKSHLINLLKLICDGVLNIFDFFSAKCILEMDKTGTINIRKLACKGIINLSRLLSSLNKNISAHKRLSHLDFAKKIGIPLPVMYSRKFLCKLRSKN